MIPRRTALKRSAPPKKRNVTRKARELARAFGPPERRAWIASQPCIACVTRSTPQASRTENVHVIGGGAGRRADFAFIVPMCADHHAILHRIGRLCFDAAHGTDLLGESKRHARWWADFWSDE